MDRPAPTPWMPLADAGWTLTADPSPADIDQAARWLAQESYWARGRPAVDTRHAFSASVAVAVHDGAGRLRGIGRCTSDGVAFGYVDDVFVAREARGRGIGRWLVAGLVNHPELRRVPRFVLLTADAHRHYAAAGFRPLTHVGEWMVWHRADGFSRTPDPW